jgi:ABC-2 type transport system permease protein
VSAVRLLVARELDERLRSKGFIVSTLVTLLIVAGVAVLPALLDDDGPTTFDVGVVDAGAGVRAAVEAAATAAGVEVDLVDVDADEGERLVENDELDAVLVDGGELLVHEEIDDRLMTVAQAAAAEVAGRAALADAGVSDAEAALALHPEPLAVRALDPPDPDEDTRDGLVFVGTMLLYGQLFGFGFWVASGLVEEKSSRVGELLLTKVRPGDALAGKVLGIGIIGLAQLLLFVVVGLGIAVAVGSVDLPPGTAGVALSVLAWFVLGFGFYSCLFAIGGALASSVEELQSTTSPVTMVVVASFVVALVAARDPSGVAAVIGTYVPTTSPMVLPIRQAAGEVAWWEMVASVAILLATTVVAVRVAARAHAGAALHVRGAMKLRDALRAAG